MISQGSQEKPYSVAILSGKGGTGKTTLALNIARVLSYKRPVWLIDLDLFNRGATSALWETEKDIPISVAELAHIIFQQGFHQQSIDNIAERLTELTASLAYDTFLHFLPAAKTSEARKSAYMLWHGVKTEGGDSARFLRCLLTCLGRVTPDAVVLLDTHGGLDDFSISAAAICDLSFIVNEPDLITFTGTLTLYREIAESITDLNPKPVLEFIINRVPPNKSLFQMDQEFGDVLRTMVPVLNPVAAYFPLEPELFSVFGSDPFVSELLADSWFSRKISYLAKRIEIYDASLGEKKIEQGEFYTNSARDERIRIALRRELHKRGDLLSTGWIVWVSITFLQLFFKAISGKALFGFDLLLFVLATAGLGLLFLSSRWLNVQLKRRRAIKRPTTRRRFGEAKIVAEIENLEKEVRQQKVKSTWLAVTIGTAIMVAIVLIATPYLFSVQKEGKQRGTMAEMREIGTAIERYAVDNNSYPSSDQLGKLLGPKYLKGLSELKLHYYTWDNNQHYLLVSPGENSKFEYDDPQRYLDAKHNPTDDIVFTNGVFLSYPEGMR
jgi:cellulose biosynthesis protein BcsQ